MYKKTQWQLFVAVEEGKCCEGGGRGERTSDNFSRRVGIDCMLGFVAHFGAVGSKGRRRRMTVDVERYLREDLSRVHELIGRYNMDELVWNHASVRLPRTGAILITPGDITFDGVTPESLVVDSANVTANVIHSAVYEAREDIGAVIHTHTPAVVTVGALRSGMRFLSQDSSLFYGGVAYYDWHGVSDDVAEKAHIKAACVDPKVNTLFMRNHGVCTFGATIQEAFVRAYFVERACRAQLEAMKTRLPLRVPSIKVVEASAKSWNSFKPGVYEWEPLKAFLDRQNGKIKPTEPVYFPDEDPKLQLLRHDLALAHRVSITLASPHLQHKPLEQYNTRQIDRHTGTHSGR